MEKPHSNISDMLPRRAVINDLSVPYRSGSGYILTMTVVATALLCALAVVASEPFLVPSIGPTIFIIFAFPLSEQAHPRNIILSTVIAILAGIASLALFGLVHVPPDLTDLSWTRAAALVVGIGLATAGISALRALHVPAIATAMIISAGLLDKPLDWLSVLIGVLFVTSIGLLINRAAGKPQALWWRPQPPTL